MQNSEIIPENHFKYYMCLFDDLTKTEDLPSENLKQLWSCEWSAQHVAEIYGLYKQLEEAAPNTINTVREIIPKLLCAIAELALIIVQHNFTGPYELSTFEDVIKKLPFDSFVELKESGEEVNPNLKLGEIMVLLKKLMDLLTAAGVKEFIFEWWQLRVIILRQQILQDLAGSLYDDYTRTATWLQEYLSQLKDIQMQATVLLEITNGFLVFQRPEMANATLERACELLRVKMKVEGLMGLRTKFQQRALPQLCLNVQTNDGLRLENAEITHVNTILPRLLMLNDDTRLERVRFISLKDNEVMSLPAIMQALVLLKAKQLRRAQPKDILSDEEIAPYILTLLYQTHGPLQVRRSTLAFNCTLECDQRRTVERSWKQCEALIKDLNNPAYSLQARFSFVFAACMQTTWDLQKQLCQICMSLGLTKTALDHYLQIQDWENVINCYTLLEMRHKAEEIIRQELAKKPTVLLYCLLGDATDDPKQFRAAWELSKETSGKAQAYWGSWHFRRQEYVEAVRHLQESVKINSLQEKAWLRLGYAAMESEQWDVAISAYLFYTHLEPCGFEAWNNLGKCLLKLGNKERAHTMLLNALKHNYNNWKLWENFLLVSADTGNMHEALRAYKTLGQLKERFLDLEVLGLVIGQIDDGRIDPTGKSNQQLRKSARELLTEQCIKHGNEYKMWLYSAMMAETPLDKAQTLVKCYKALTTLKFDWKNVDSVLAAYELCLELCKSSLQAHRDNSAADSNVKKQIHSQLSSARLITQACLRSTAKETLENVGEKAAKVAELAAEIERCMEELKQVLTALSA